MNAICYKNLLLKWLFATILLFSFFTFSGFAYQTQANHEKQPTTLIVSLNLRAAKSINYKQALKAIPHKYLSLFSLSNASYLYTRQVEVLIKDLHARVLRPQTALFYRVKTIPQNTSDEPAILIG